MVHAEKDEVSCLAENVKIDLDLTFSMKDLDPESSREREAYILSIHPSDSTLDFGSEST